MEWALLSWIIISVLIGWQAHLTKGRTARAWGFLTFVLLVTLKIMFSRASTEWHRIPEDTGGISQEEFHAIIAMVIGGPLMSLIVWRLPKIHRPER